MNLICCADLLDDLNLGDKGRPGTLKHLAFVIGENVYNAAKGAAKDRVVSMLDGYYRAPGRFEKLWNGLNAAERRIAALHVWGEGSEPTDCADDVAREFGLTEKPKERYYFYARNGLDRFKEKYAGNRSALWLLFPESYGNWLFDEELRGAVGEMKRVYSKVPDTLVFSTRENRMGDFANILRFCNSNRLTVTKNGMLSKPSAMKLRDFCGYEEFAADIEAQPKDMRTTESLLVTYPLAVLCVLSGLLAVAEGECVPGGKALSLIDLSPERFVKKLFEAYLKSKSYDEITTMRGILPKRGHDPSDARQSIADELKYCPPGQAVYTKELERHLRIAEKNFARKEARYVTEHGISYSNFGVEWEYYEHPLIYTILSFFGALGIIDIAWGENPGVYADRGRRLPIAFRINPLGAYVLGLSGSYTAPAKPKAIVKGGFTVLPDYTVVVPESSNRFRHELYFDKLFTRVSATDEASIYRLDFETAVRAVDSGAGVADLRGYLSASDKPVPDNVVRALDDWEKQAGRIRLRQVTILECDDAALLEEVTRYRGMGEFVKEKIAAAVVVDGDSMKKIKKAIEKNKRFCRNVI
ncbi:MAG: helicase-associated domain-containing protein [Peptococcaceae bacterium]|jgi:hypothetical protein|nr:helicase-associated domain-containing protein [Peptococcaceae bacterium]